MDNEKNNGSVVIKAGIWYTLCNFLVRGLTFITTPLFTRFMSTDDIGAFSNIQSWFSILAIITTIELFSSVNVAQFDYKDELDSYVSSVLVLGSVITGIFYAIVLCFHVFFEAFFEMDFNTINLIFLYLLVYPAIQMFQIKNQIIYNYIPTVVVSLTSSLISSMLSLILAYVCKNQLNGRVYGYFVPLIVCSIIVYFIILKSGKKISTKYWRYALMISFPLIWHLLANNILNSSDRIMINKMIGKSENAIYTIAYSCGMLVSLLWGSMNNAWSPWAYQQMDKKEYNKLKDYSKPYTIFFMIVVLFFMLFAPELLYIMGGKKYMSGIYVIPPVMIGFIFQFIYSLYVNIEFYCKKQFFIAIGTIIAAFVNFILNYIFIPIFGYIAAAYTTLIGYILLFVIHYYLVYRLGKSEWYDIRFFIKVIVFAFMELIIMNAIYTRLLFRIIMIIVVVLISLYFIIRKRKELKEAISKRSLIGVFDAFSIK